MDNSSGTNELNSHYSQEISVLNRKHAHSVQIVDLDDCKILFPIKSKTTGYSLLVEFCQNYKITDVKYFCFYWLGKFGDKKWIDLKETVKKQISNNSACLYFAVRYYAPNVTGILNKTTKNLFYLQIKKDFLTNSISASTNTLMLLSVYAMKADYGDFPEEWDPHYDQLVEKNKLSTSLEANTIRKMHETMKKISRGTAKNKFLSISQRLPYYGNVFFPGTLLKRPSHVGISATGVVIYIGNIRTHRLVWPKIIKFESRGILFYMKARKYDNKVETYIFNLKNWIQSKRMLTTAKDFHQFFRLCRHPFGAEYNNFDDMVGSPKKALGRPRSAQLSPPSTASTQAFTVKASTRSIQSNDYELSLHDAIQRATQVSITATTEAIFGVNFR